MLNLKCVNVLFTYFSLKFSGTEWLDNLVIIFCLYPSFENIIYDYRISIVSASYREISIILLRGEWQRRTTSSFA